MRKKIHSRLLQLSLMTILLGYQPTVYAIYKCTDSSGHQSYQDKPCASNTTSQSINIRSSKAKPSIDSDPFWYPVSLRKGHRTLRLLMMSDWVVIQKNRLEKSGAFELEVVKPISNDNSSTFKILISYLPFNYVGPNTINLSRTNAFKTMKSSFEGQLNDVDKLIPLGKAPIKGYYYEAKDPRWKNKQPTRGQYAYMLQAVMQVNNGRLIYTILHNQPSTPDHAAALTALNNIQLRQIAFNKSFQEMSSATQSSSSEKQQSKAIHQFFDDMENADPESQYMVGIWAMDIDKTEARYWLNKAAKKGYKPALIKLVELQLDADN